MIKQLLNEPDAYLIRLKSRIKLRLFTGAYRKWFRPFYGNFRDKKGLEIGGPSILFSGKIMPVYQLAESIDGCNFSSHTVWEGEIISSDYNYFETKHGRQFILEGTDLSSIKNEEYDFVLSCHNLEHIANPLKAIMEWVRVLKKGGTLLLVLPDKRYTFDRKRNYTDFSHLLQDLKNNTDEKDLTHLQEILELHDARLDPPVRNNFELLKERSHNNFENRCMHHHVFGAALLKEIMTYAGLKTVSQKFIPPFNQVIIGIK